MAKKMKRSTTEDESSSGGSASLGPTNSSSDDISREETTKRRRRRSEGRRNTSKKERSYSQGKEIKKFLAEVKEEVCKQLKQVAESKEELSKQLEKLREEMCKQSKQVTESKEETYKQLDRLREEMCKQSKQATESKEELCKQLEKVDQDNQEMRKQLTEITTDLRKYWDLHTNGSSGDDSDAQRSQSNPLQPPRYRLVLKSGVTDKIGKGEPIDISVSLVDGNDQTVENGPLASATVELVVVSAEFNEHNNQHNWSREDFEINIKKPRQGTSATADLDQSVKSIVSDGRFNLVQGVKFHSGSKIFRNSGNKKVRLGVMVVSPTEERVLEGLSSPFFVRGHDRLRHNRLNTQRQALVENGYQEQNGTMPDMQNPSWTNSTQFEEIRSNSTEGPPHFPMIGSTTTLSPGLNITGGQPQLPFRGNTTMLSTEPSTSRDEQAVIQQYQVPHLPMLAQATNNRIDELSAAMAGNDVRHPNFMRNNYVPGQEIGTPYYTILPVRLIWDRLNVDLLDHFSVTTVYKPSNRKLLQNSTRQLFLSRLTLKGQFLTLQTLSCTEKGITSSRFIFPKLCTLSIVSSCPQLFMREPLFSATANMAIRTLKLADISELNSLSLWRMNISLCQHLTKLHLLGLMSCEELPQLCQLPVLQILCLEKLRSLCSHVVSTPFPKLRELRLHDLDSLEKWVVTEGKEEQLIFPSLEKIVIRNCPKLTRLPEAPLRAE